MNQKVELVYCGENSYKVVKLTNRLEPSVGSIIDKSEVKSLLDLSRKGKMSVVIRPNESA